MAWSWLQWFSNFPLNTPYAAGASTSFGGTWELMRNAGSQALLTESGSAF